MESKTYSIMSLNVHNFMDSNMVNSLNKIKQLIIKYDIIALQEVYDIKKLHEITKNYNYCYNKSTLILTKFQIKPIINNKTKECFSSLIISLPYNKNILVSNIHLNYKDEKIRINEYENIYEKIEYYTYEYPSILLGDFNSLTKTDYDDKQWAHIYNTRKKGLWELPQTKLTDIITKEWYDAGKQDKKPTSRYDTRIDYIYTKNINVICYNIVKTIPNISDHNLISIKFNV